MMKQDIRTMEDALVSIESRLRKERGFVDEDFEVNRGYIDCHRELELVKMTAIRMGQLEIIEQRLKG